MLVKCPEKWEAGYPLGVQVRGQPDNPPKNILYISISRRDKMTQLLTIQKPSQNTTIPALKWNEENKVNIWIINFFKKALFLEISIYK